MKFVFTTETAIETLEADAVAFDEEGEVELSARYQYTANIVRQFRDTLISIANCQGGIPSEQAHKVLEETGHCAHSRAVFKAIGEPAWRCPECDAKSEVAMVSFR